MLDPWTFLQMQFEKIGGRSIAYLDGSLQPDLTQLRQLISSSLASQADSIRHQERQREWILSRLLMQRLAGYIPNKGEQGELIWRQGHGGSLSHKKGHVALAFEFSASEHDDPGVDLELLRDLDDDLALKIVNLDEMKLATAIGAGWSTAVFSAKEAIFKSLFRRVGFRFYYEAAELIDVCPANNQGVLIFRITRALGPDVPEKTLIRVDYKQINLGAEFFWLTSARRN